MPWLVLTLELDDTRAEAVSDALLEAGAISVSVEDADAGTASETPQYREPGQGRSTEALGTTAAPWRRNRISALVPWQADARAVVADAARAAGLDRVPGFGVARLEDDDWVRRTQSQFEPIRVGELLWIVPSWHEPPQPDAVVLRLDPGLAFGTGSHPSTRLALRFLERTAVRHSVLDYGCGSGILAIAAAKLGADSVDATDLDPQALDAAASNARRNDVAVRVVPPEALPVGEYDVVVANILANPLIELAPRLVARTRRGGRIALSGVLEAQAPGVRAAYAPAIALAVSDAEEGWVLLEGERAARPREDRFR
jgi:ribosomal protein L11 methyltransferase